MQRPDSGNGTSGSRRALAQSGQTPTRSAYDNLLLTVEQRAEVTP